MAREASPRPIWPWSTPGAPDLQRRIEAAPAAPRRRAAKAYMRICHAPTIRTPSARQDPLPHAVRAQTNGGCWSWRRRPAGCTRSGVHLASLGRPIPGDARYGGALTVGGHPRARLMLHAAAPWPSPTPRAGPKLIGARSRPTCRA